MKKILIIFLLASCVEAEEPGNRVSYEVECDHCLASFPDNMFEKSIVVSGRLFYAFDNVSLDSVYVRLEKSAIVPQMTGKVVIRHNYKVVEKYEGDIDGTTVKTKL